LTTGKHFVPKEERMGPPFLHTGAQRLLPMPRRGRLPANHPLPHVYRFPDEPQDKPVAGEDVRDPNAALVEALLLTADEPLAPRKLARAAGLTDATEARQVVRQLQELYDRDGTAFQVVEIAGGYQLLTRPEYHRWLVRLRTGQDLRLTAAARETLAIVAYRQPIMRADIEAVRGVHCGETLRLLMEKGLIRVAGRDASLGRPVLYGTTRKFLQMFGLKSLKDLPEVEDLKMPERKHKDKEGEPPGEAGAPPE
jgi:segregation and condensation protein B